MNECMNVCFCVCYGGTTTKLQADLEVSFWEKYQEVEFQVLENTRRKWLQLITKDINSSDKIDHSQNLGKKYTQSLQV